MDMNLSKLQEIVKDRGIWGSAIHGVAKRQNEQINNSNNSKLFGLLCQALESLTHFSHS